MIINKLCVNMRCLYDNQLISKCYVVGITNAQIYVLLGFYRISDDFDLSLTDVRSRYGELFTGFSKSPFSLLVGTNGFV
jgi:hypothetical protein